MNRSIQLVPGEFDTLSAEQPLEVSVVLPCLNEKETVAICVSKAIATLEEAGTSGEVIVADNGSTDGSIELAQSAGARIVHVQQRGYGNALNGGIQAARGLYVVMADSDDSYDFRHIPRFIEQLRNLEYAAHPSRKWFLISTHRRATRRASRSNTVGSPV